MMGVSRRGAGRASRNSITGQGRPTVTLRNAGSILRLAGPALQVISLIGLFRAPRSDAGDRIRLACMALFGLGLILVIVGNVLARMRRPAGPRARDEKPDPTPRDDFDR
jgi:hypothetical protein